MININFYDLYKISDTFKATVKPLEDANLRTVMANVLLEKVKKRFMDRQNPDGKFQTVSEAAKIRQGRSKTHKSKLHPNETRGSDARWHTGGQTYLASGRLSKGFVVRKMGLERRIENLVKSEMAINYSKAPWNNMTLLELLEIRFPNRIIMGVNRKDIDDMMGVMYAAINIATEKSTSKSSSRKRR